MPFNAFNSIAKLPKKSGGIISAPNFIQVSSTVTSTRYFDVAISNSGQYILCAVGVTSGQPTSALLYLSTNYGSTFNSISGFSTTQNYPCAMSGTGQYMVMLVNGGYMYRSGNYGANWAQVTNISTTQNWTNVSLSKDGKYCLANGNSPTNNLYVSSNFDTSNPTFTQLSVYASMNASLRLHSVSNTGQYMIQLNWRPADGIAISTDYGVSFTKLTFANIGITGTLYPQCINITQDNTVYFLNYNEGIYKSTSLFSGSPMFTRITSATFTEQSWLDIVVSEDGTYVVASTNAKTYYSIDSGVTWSLAYTGRIALMAMSADARYIVASNTDYSSKLLFSST
jgi:photosystem II stability/assembly factor-like uncharacterized protein